MKKGELERIIGKEISKERMQTLYDITEYTQGRKEYKEIRKYLKQDNNLYKNK